MKKYQKISFLKTSNMLEMNINGVIIKIDTINSIIEKEKIHQTTLLVCENVDLEPYDRVQLYGSDRGILATYIGKQLINGQVDLLDYDFIQVTLAEKTIQLNQISNANILYDPINNKKIAYYDKVIIHQPKGRAVARRILLEATLTLKDEGVLYITGSNNSGVRSSVSDAELLFGNSKILRYKKGNLIARFIKPGIIKEAPSWAKLPGIAPGTWFHFKQMWGEEILDIYTLPGIFSYQRLDDGTRFLLNNIPDVSNKKIIDVGCGYGIIGLITQKKGARFVSFVDNNLLAIACTHKNMQKANLLNYKAIAGNVLSEIDDLDYDLAISNPPFHNNIEINYRVARDIIKQSWQILCDGGQLIIVANLFLRYEKIMKEYFKSIEHLDQNNRYHVLLATK